MSLDTRQIERDVEAAVGADTASIAERVRAITLAALTEGRLDSALVGDAAAHVIEGKVAGQGGIRRRIPCCGVDPVDDPAHPLAPALDQAFEAHAELSGCW